MTTEKIKSLLLMNENKKITVTLLAKKMNVSKGRHTSIIKPCLYRSQRLKLMEYTQVSIMTALIME